MRLTRVTMAARAWTPTLDRRVCVHLIVQGGGVIRVSSSRRVFVAQHNQESDGWKERAREWDGGRGRERER